MINNYNPVTMGGVLPPYWDSALIHKDVSGSIASFLDGADGLPLKSCVVRIEPVQASGTPSPETPLPISGWIAANLELRGKNFYKNIQSNLCPSNNSKWKTNSVNGATMGTSISGEFGFLVPVKPNTRYTFAFTKNQGDEYLRCAVYSKKPTSYSDSSRLRILINEGDPIRSGRHIRTVNTGNGARWMLFTMYRSYNSVGYAVSDVYCGLANTGTTFIPFAGTTLPITFIDPSTGDPLTIYGGTVTLNPDGSADIVSTMGNIASYDGETLPGAWISSMDVYEEGATPTTGAQVVYELETPLTYHIENVGNLQTLLGVNNIWADTGDIDLTYYADATLAHEAQTAELQALILEQ